MTTGQMTVVARDGECAIVEVEGRSDVIAVGPSGAVECSRGAAERWLASQSPRGRSDAWGLLGVSQVLPEAGHMRAAEERRERLRLAVEVARVGQTYVVISDESYPTNTSAEIEAAQRALAAEGLESAPIYAGDPADPDSYANGQVLFAGAPRTWTGLEITKYDASRPEQGVDLIEALAEWRLTEGIAGGFFAPLAGQEDLDPSEYGPALDAVDWTGFDEAAAAVAETVASPASLGRWTARWVAGER